MCITITTMLTEIQNNPWTWCQCVDSELTNCFKSVLCLVAQSCPTLCDPMDCSPPGFSVHENSPGKNSEVGCHALLQGVFPTQGSNPGLLHFRQILYHLSHQAIPWILEWIAYPFSRGSSRPRIPTRVSCIAGGFFASWATEVDKISQKNTFHVFVALYIK